MNENKENLDELEVTALIYEYENSVDMPTDERVTRLSADNHVCVKGWNDNWDKVVAYGRKCREYLRFGDEVDLATCGKLHPLNQLKVCDTPELLLKAGFDQKPMLYTQRHLMDALHIKDEDNYHWHGLSVEQVKRLPALLENPVLLSDTPSRSDTLLAVLAEVDSDKLPLLVSIKPDGKGNYSLQEIETNIILTVFGKDDFGKYFDAVITPNKVIYFNEKQGRKLETLAERQLFRCHPIACDLDGVIIRRPQCLVNKETAGQEAVPPSAFPDLDSESRDMISAKDALASENPAAEIDAPKTDR